MRLLAAALLLTLLLPLRAAELKVASLHPLIGDLARQVGGERVEVVDLIGKNGDPHRFEPLAADLAKAGDVKLYLVSGMGLESYLESLRGIAGGKATVVEIGKDLPPIEEEHDHADHSDQDPEHHHAVDPHWWHSIDLFRRATTVMAESLTQADPAGAELYAKNANAYRAKLDELDRWARKEIARVPRERRQLATAHAAFAYFCKAYNFEAIPLQGLNREQMPDPKQLAALIARLKEHKVAAIFPEKESNPKILEILTKDTGIKTGEALYADGSGASSYEEMIRHNVSAIVAGLAPAEAGH